MPYAKTSIDWAAGYACEWRAVRVDPCTWEAGEAIDGVKTASVERGAGGRLLETGSITLEAPRWDGGERWVRLEMLARQDGRMERHAVATLLCAPSSTTVRRGGVTSVLEGRSTLAPADDEKMPTGSYAPEGENAAEYVAALLGRCIPAPVRTEGSFALREKMVFARGTSVLEAVRMVLDAAGWCIQIDGSGQVAVRAMPSEPALHIGRENMRLIGTSVESDEGAAEVPNRYYAWADGALGVAVDVDPASPTSYASRGRWVDVVEESAKPVAGETVQQYAERRLAEATSVSGTRRYTRAWWPGVTVCDVVRGSLQEASLSGDMRVVSQSLVLGEAGVTVKETLEVMR